MYVYMFYVCHCVLVVCVYSFLCVLLLLVVSVCVTLNSHSKIQVLSDPTLGNYYAITYQEKVSGQPDPWNKSW